MSEVKQEGEFKIQKNTSPKKFKNRDEVIKVDLSNPPANKVEETITKVVMPSTEEPKETVVTDNNLENTVIIEEIIKTEDLAVETKELQNQVIESIEKQETQGKKLPENIQKLVSFMEETGGTVEDYVRLNTDYSNVNEEALLKEYYKKTKPYLSKEEIDFTIEDSFYYDEDLEEERDIKKKKLAFKEEVEKAKGFLEGVKNKYYEEIKMNSNNSPERNEAIEFFNRYKEGQEKAKSSHERFKLDTKKFFNSEFKGFEYGVGDKQFRYGITNNEQVAEKQTDINNFVGKFLDSDGNVIDTAGYHKALYTAMNADKVAQHFYEQGKADAVKEVISNSKNPSLSQPRQTSGEVFINGLKVKSVSGFDSSKLRIKTKKFN
jgi:hypothetical protein